MPAPAPLQLLPASATILDANISLLGSQHNQVSPYSGKSLVVRRATPTYRGRLRLRVRDEAGDDEMLAWFDTHALSSFGVEIWRLEGGHDLPPLPQILSQTFLQGARSQWVFASEPDAEWINRLTIVSGRAFRILEIDGVNAIVSPGVNLPLPATPEPPDTAALRVQQVTPAPLSLRFSGGMSQDITIEVIETPGRVVGISPVLPVQIPPNALVWLNKGLLWGDKFLIWLPGEAPTPEDGLSWAGRRLRWQGKYLAWSG